MSAPDFARAVDRLIRLVAHWEAGRWSTAPAPSIAGPPAAAGSAAPTRAELLYAQIQRLADLTADTEHRPRRQVPRLGDGVLPDQLRVIADDLLAAAPPAALVEGATGDVNALRSAL